MKERTKVIIIALCLLALGAVFFFASIYWTYFNFYKAELEFSGTNVKEKLFFVPDKPYHTLYRNFESSLHVIKPENKFNYVFLDSVSCSNGKAYAVSSYKRYIFENNGFSEAHNLPYTENNEYGCTFGYETDFKNGMEYSIDSSFFLHAENLFLIKNKYYIKFIAYSRGKHKLLVKNKNLFLKGNVVSKNIYLPNDYVIVYVPYNGDIIGYKIIRQNCFKFDNGLLFYLLILPFPAVFFVLLWFCFGRELSFKELPSSLSYFPQTKRKGWEVAAFFNPPFSVADNNFFSSILLDFKRKKIIDLKSKGNDTYIKLIKDKTGLDEIEGKFYLLLEKIKSIAKKENKEGDYFILNRVLNQWFVKFELSLYYKSLQIDDKVKEIGKEYISGSMIIIQTIIWFVFIASLIVIGSGFIGAFQTNGFLIIFAAISFVFIGIVLYNSAILIKFNKEYYAEYQEWQAFKNYLYSFPSMKSSPPEAVRLWEIYLVYASALGVAKEVLKALENWHVLTENQARAYSRSIIVAGAMASSSGSSGSKGSGFGGAGGGGVGGGGGGGR